MTRTRSPIRLLAALCVVGAVSIVGPAAWAHPHKVETGAGRLQPIANSQNHYAFDSTGLSCDTMAAAGTAPVGPAWYGLESAHHGPDSGVGGKGDGCYQLDATTPGADINNPTIK